MTSTRSFHLGTTISSIIEHIHCQDPRIRNLPTLAIHFRAAKSSPNPSTNAFTQSDNAIQSIRTRRLRSVAWRLRKSTRSLICRRSLISTRSRRRVEARGGRLHASIGRRFGAGIGGRPAASVGGPRGLLQYKSANNRPRTDYDTHTPPAPPQTLPPP